MLNLETDRLYENLKEELPDSSFAERRAWAGQIIDSNIDLQQLLPLLQEKRNIAYRFSWLLSDIGEVSAESLFKVLDHLFQNRVKVNAPKFEQQFVKYWRIAGIPEAHKGEAIDMMFNWLTDHQTSVHIRTISLEVLYQLTTEYPELKNEIRVCLETEIEQSAISFRKKANKIYAKL